MKNPALPAKTDGARIIVGSADSPNGLWLLNLLGEFTRAPMTSTVSAWNSAPNPESLATVEANQSRGGDSNETFRCFVMEARRNQLPTLAERDWPVSENGLAEGLSQWANTLARSAPAAFYAAGPLILIPTLGLVALFGLAGTRARIMRVTAGGIASTWKPKTRLRMAWSATVNRSSCR